MHEDNLTFLSFSEKNERYMWLKDHNIDPDKYLKSLGHDNMPPIDTMEDAYFLIKEKTRINEKDIETFPAILSYSKKRIEDRIELLTETFDLDKKVIDSPKVFGPSEKYMWDRYKLIFKDFGLDKNILSNSNIYEISEDNIINTFNWAVKDLGLDKKVLNHATIFDLSENNIKQTVLFFRNTVGLDNEQIENHPIYITMSLNRMEDAYNVMTETLCFDSNNLNLDKLFFKSSKDVILGTKEFLDDVYSKLTTIPASVDYNNKPNILLRSAKEFNLMKDSYCVMTNILGFEPNSLDLEKLLLKSSKDKITTSKRRLDELYISFTDIPASIDYKKYPNLLLLTHKNLDDLISPYKY